MSVSQVTTYILWAGTAAMTLGSLAFWWMGRDADEDMRDFFIITIFITSIASVNYLAMALGFGVFELTLEGGKVIDVFWARYSDWVFTTPLLLLDLGLLVNADKETIGTLVGLDVLMILTGVVATYSTKMTNRIVWWAVSTGFLVFLVYYLVGALSEQASKASGDVQSLFSKLRNIIIVLWFAYPVVWIVGTEGLGLLPLTAETALFAILDVSAKVGFGFVLLSSRDALSSARSSAGSGSGEAAAATAD